MENQKRIYNFNIITYLKPEFFIEVLNKPIVKHWAYILHDKDMKEDGSPVEPHYHILMLLYNNKSLSAARKMFPSDQTTRLQPMLDKSDCFTYLDHSDKPNKFQYDHNDIVCDDSVYWHRLMEQGDYEDKTVSLVNDLINGISLDEYMVRYGRDGVLNYGKYLEFAEKVKRFRHSHLYDMDTGELLK